MDYLKVWTSFRAVISPLNDSEKGRLFDSMLEYAETGKEPSEFKGNERYLWQVAKQDIDRTAQKCETLKANGSKPKQREATGSKPKQEEAKPTYKDNDNDNSKDKDKDNHYLKEKVNKEKEPPRRFTPPTVEDVKAYCTARNNGVDAQRFVDYYTANGWRVGKNPMKDWQATVRTWERSDSIKQPVKAGSAQDYGQRDYTGVVDELADEQARFMDEYKRGVS